MFALSVFVFGSASKRLPFSNGTNVQAVLKKEMLDRGLVSSKKGTIYVRSMHGVLPSRRDDLDSYVA